MVKISEHKNIIIRTENLEGAALDWAIGKAVGKQVGILQMPGQPPEISADGSFGGWEPSQDWAQGGPLIDKHVIELEKECLSNGEQWVVWVDKKLPAATGQTLLIAAMRAIVAALLGDAVDIPKELINAAN